MCELSKSVVADICKARDTAQTAASHNASVALRREAEVVALTAQRDALLAAAEAVMWGCKGCDWEKEHPSEPCEWKGHAQLRAAVQTAKGGA